MTSKRTRALFCDLLGLTRGKYVPSSVAAGGQIGFAAGVFGTTFDRDLINVPGIGLYQGLPDMELKLDEERRQAWQANTELAIGDLHFKGEPFGLCGRSALKRAVAAWGDKGLKPMVGLELEAYVFEQDQDGAWRPYDTPGAHVYGTGPANDPRGLMEAIWEQAYACGIQVESMNGEYDNGQFELTLCFDEAVRACDDAFLFKTLAKEIALSKGLILTFMPKPIPERGGSGMHINFSFTDQSGNNVIAPDGELSKVAQDCIAGMINHHEGLAGLCATTVNSYERLQPGSMAGYWANWADDHRLVTVRSSVKSAKSARLEHRMADCATNPYVATAAVLQASLLGLEAGLALPQEEHLDGLENCAAEKHVPAGLGLAMKALENDNVLTQAVGYDLCQGMIALKRDEAKRLDGKKLDEIRNFYLPFV